MNRWKVAQASSALMILVSLLGLIFLPNLGLGRVMVSFCIPVCIGLFIWVDRKMQKMGFDRTVELNQITAIRTMDYQRHDWMNDLQVIYGYLKLKRYDKLEICIEKIKEKMNRDSRLARIGIPSLILFLLSFRSQSFAPFQLRINFTEEINMPQKVVDSSLVSNIIMETILYFQHAAKPANSETNQLNMNFELKEHYLLLVFQYTGELQTQVLKDTLI
ncbi:MAG TPA: Spo0B domain-containing protein, partial [Bacilli bacterium]